MSLLTSDQEAPTGSTWLCPHFLFSFARSISLLPLWYLCVGSCRGDKTHKHCGGRQEAPWNHNGVTAALRSLSLCSSQHGDRTALSFALFSLISLIIISIAFSAVPLSHSSSSDHISCFSIWKIAVWFAVSGMAGVGRCAEKLLGIGWFKSLTCLQSVYFQEAIPLFRN